MVEFIDAHRDGLGVEPICKALQVAPSMYYAAKKRRPSARSVRDALLVSILVALWTANYRVYGAHKLWKAARRAGHDLGRDQVARLMRIANIHGVSRKRRLRTTRPDPDASRPADLVKRDFTATRPNALWVTALTFAVVDLDVLSAAQTPCVRRFEPRPTTARMGTPTCRAHDPRVMRSNCALTAMSSDGATTCQWDTVD